MDPNYSRKSNMNSVRMFHETLNRGHQSEITDVKKRPHRAHNLSGRRYVTYKGSQSKQRQTTEQQSHRGRSRVRQTPASSKNASMVKQAAVFSESGLQQLEKGGEEQSTSVVGRQRSRTPGTSRSRSRSTIRTTAAKKQFVSPKAPSRAASIVGGGSHPASRRASDEPLDLPPAEGTPGVVKDIAAILREPSPPEFVLTTEETKLVSSPKSSDSDAETDEDEDDEDPASKSPSLVGYRKLVFNEDHNKWIEHWKVEEDLKRARERQKREAVIAKIRPQVNPHKVKGRITAKMQVMFPTAIVRANRHKGFNHITITDPLRIELHKRKATIVPTFYQDHIIKFGKLPFRNNPRPHPIV